MVDFKSHIQRILPDLLAETKAFLVDVTVSHEGRLAKVEVLVDTDTGITIDQCAGIIRQLGRALDELATADTPFRLEVSSPGIDKPLRHLRQYPKNVGRTFDVRHRVAAEVVSFRGTLRSVEGAELTFETADGQVTMIPMDRMVESREVLPW